MVTDHGGFVQATHSCPSWRGAAAIRGYFCSAAAVGGATLACAAAWRRCTASGCRATHSGMAAAASGGLELLGSRADHSWVRQLTEDPERPVREPNKTSRQVRSGHYVLVKPTPLAEPFHIIHSKEMAAELGLDDEACASEEFVKMFSAGQQADGFESWATPYALSIYGQEMYQNCPFKNGNGYGDGRAITLGEVVIPSAAGAGGTRWELQLKGAGTTPFCRGGDGRAVLRSSIREFLVSEAMHHLGVSTTRALSLMGSRSETVSRPWYSNSREVPGVDDPRLAHLPMETRKQLLAQLGSQLQQPDVMISEQCAITCRVATSFTRVGHIELHGRRCKKSDTPENREALEKIVKHAIEREFWDDDPDGEIGTRILRMLGASQQRIAALTADWIRVGFCQGNFNSDNCLVAGRTMDYGPFGFMEQFAPLWNMWSGGGDHFGFLNQPTAGMTNFKSLLTAVVPLLSEAEQRAAVALGENSDRVATKALEERCWRPKLGFRDWDKSATPHGAQSLLDKLLPLLTHTRCDWTMFWRQLAELAELADAIDVDAADEAEIFKPLLPCFHECTGPEQGASHKHNGL